MSERREREGQWYWGGGGEVKEQARHPFPRGARGAGHGDLGAGLGPVYLATDAFVSMARAPSRRRAPPRCWSRRARAGARAGSSRGTPLCSAATSAVATHHGIFDLSYMRCIPNLTISAPRNEVELRHLMFTAQQPNMGPFVIRYPRGKGTVIDWKVPMKVLQIGKGEQLKEGADLAVLTIGAMAHSAQLAIEQLEKEKNKTYTLLAVLHQRLQLD